MLNRVILIGRLASDPELKYTPSGIPVAEFRIAVDRPMSSEARAAGQEKQADFISIVAWRQSAEFAANYLHKGRLVAVEGRLQVRDYVAQDGQKRRIYEVVADNLKGLDRPNREGGEGEGEGGGYSGGRGNGGSSNAGGYERSTGGGTGGTGGGYAAGGGAARPAGGGYASGGGPARGGTPAGGGGAGGRGSSPASQPAGSGGGDFDDDYGDLSDPFAE